MANIQRVRVALSGLPGLPGVATYYAVDAASFLPKIQLFWAQTVALMPSGFLAQVENIGDTIEASTGALTGSWSGPAQGVAGGGGTGVYSAPTGACVNWITDVVADGSRVRGRSFIVPLSATAFDLTGSLSEPTLAALRTSAAELIGNSNSNFAVWHRPSLGTPATPTRPARPAHAGLFAFVTKAVIRDSAAVLRSRRD